MRNARYRPWRGADAESIRFPYGDRSFDLACVFAVFMHMKLPEIARYLEELARVMTPESALSRDVPGGARRNAATTNAGT